MKRFQVTVDLTLRHIVFNVPAETGEEAAVLAEDIIECELLGQPERPPEEGYANEWHIMLEARKFAEVVDDEPIPSECWEKVKTFTSRGWDAGDPDLKLRWRSK